MILQTQPNSLVWYDVKRKKPFLQLKILKLIGKSGSLSKGMTEKILKTDNHHHREILESYTALEKKCLISNVDYENPGVGKTLPRGRRNRSYQITDLGFNVLINEGLDVSEFWMTMVNYCYYAKAIDSHTIDSFYHSFLSHRLKYKSVIGNGYFFSQLDFFNYMSKKWISDKIHVNGNAISLSQKIIETLAMFPGVKFKDLAHKINASEHCLNMELRKLTAERGNEAFLIDQQDYHGTNFLRDQMSYILYHNLVKRTTHDQGKETTLSLSVFGVILSIKLIRLHNLNRIKRLYLFNDYSMCNAIDLIADNYRTSLPLIFGEWYLLKRTLKTLSIYNFDIIIGMKPIVDDKGRSVLLSGNKEYFDIMAEIVDYSFRQLMEIWNKGNAIYSKFVREKGITKIESVSNKLSEIKVLTGIPPGAFLAGTKLEDAFANEISFHYYLNLNQDFIYPSMDATDYSDVFGELLSMNEDNMDEDKLKSMEHDRNSLAPLVLSPKQRLLDISNNSSIIRNALMMWINDCTIFNKETGSSMDRFYNEIR